MNQLLSRYVLAVTTLNPDFTDEGGHRFPENGSVEANDFTHDKDIMTGLHGCHWGQMRDATWMNRSPDAVWAVVRVDTNQPVVFVDKNENHIKFKSAIVLFSTSGGTAAEECNQFIKEHRDKRFNNIQENNETTSIENIVGSTVEEKESTEPVIASTFQSYANSYSTATPAIATGQEGSATTQNALSHALALAPHTRAVACGDLGSAIAAEAFCRVHSSGCDGRAIATGPGSIVLGLGDNNIAAGLGSDSIGSVGKNGILILPWHDGARIRYKVGYAGEDIDPNVRYRVEDDQFVRID